MNIFEFMKAIQIPGTAVSVYRGLWQDTVVVDWRWVASDDTQQKVVREVSEYTIPHLRLLVDEVKHIIEVKRNAQ